MTISRRRLLAGLGMVLAAPVIVRASSIMPVRPIKIVSPYPLGLARALRDGEAVVYGLDAYGRPMHEILQVQRSSVVSYKVWKHIDRIVFADEEFPMAASA